MRCAARVRVERRREALFRCRTLRPCRSADAATSARSSTHTRRTTPRPNPRRRSPPDGGAARDYQAEFDRIWQTYGFDGDLSGAIVEDGVAYRETPSGRVPIARETTTGLWTPVLGLPDRDASPRQVVRYLYTQNLPGAFPFTEGAYRFRRKDEDPIRMFAGLGMPETTNAPLPPPRRRTRRASALHRVRLPHALWPRLRRAGRARQGRGGRCRRRHARRHAAPLRRLRPLAHVRFDDHQRPSADADGDVPRRSAQARLRLEGAARHRAGRHPQGSAGAERGALPAGAVAPPHRRHDRLHDAGGAGLVPAVHPPATTSARRARTRSRSSRSPLRTASPTSRRCGRAACPSRSSRAASRSSSRPAPNSSSTCWGASRGASGQSRSSAATASRAPALRCASTARRPGARCRTQSRWHNLTRVALQAEHALHNNTNSLHTNSYKETYTTPQEGRCPARDG